MRYCLTSNVGTGCFARIPHTTTFATATQARAALRRLIERFGDYDEDDIGKQFGIGEVRSDRVIPIPF